MNERGRGRSDALNAGAEWARRSAVDSIGSLTTDPRLQALLIAFVFGTLVEGAAGFGTPVAVAAAMQTGLGFTPFDAGAICLLASSAPVAFGSIGIPVVTLAGITGRALKAVRPAALAAGASFAGVQFIVSNFIAAELTGILTGDVMGKMISLRTIAVAAASTNMSVAGQARFHRYFELVVLE